MKTITVNMKYFNKPSKTILTICLIKHKFVCSHLGWGSISQSSPTVDTKPGWVGCIKKGIQGKKICP